MKKIGVFGDSILGGTVLNRETGRYSRTASKYIEELNEKYRDEIVNYSQFGCTSQKGLLTIGSVVGADSEKGCAPQYAVVEYGGNDCDFHWREIADDPDAEHLPKTTIDTFRSTMKSIVSFLKEKGVTPVLMTLPPIDAEKYIKWVSRGAKKAYDNILKWLGDVQMIYRFHEMYSNAVAAVAAECGCAVVDVRSAFLDKHNFKELICDDGIHPNENGYRLIVNRFEGFIAANNGAGKTQV